MRRRPPSIRFRGNPAPDAVSNVRALDRLETPDYNRLLYVWLQNVWVNEHDVPIDPSALESFDDSGVDGEFRRYVRTYGARGLHRGGTVEEVWLGRQIATRAPLMVLLSSAQPACPVDRITRRRRWRPEIVVDYLECVLEVVTGCRVLVFDGRRGYTIYPKEFDPRTGGLVYSDPWPGDSVLCAKQNSAGARAVRHTRGDWLISRSDFSRVLFAALFGNWVFDTLGDWDEWASKLATGRSKTEGIL